MFLATDSMGFLFYSAAAVYQWGLAILVVAAGRLTAVRAGLVFVLAANGAQALLRFLPWHEIIANYGYIRVLDATIVATLAFVLTRFPAPLGGSRGSVVIRWAYGTSVLVVAALWLVPGAFEAMPAIVRWFLDQNPFFFALLPILAMHTLPKTMRLHPGPLRVQSSLIAAGLGLVATRIGFGYGATPFEPANLFSPGEIAVAAAAALTLGYFAAAGVVVAVVGAVRARAADLAVPAVALPCMAGLGVASWAGVGNLAWVDLVETAIRPVLIALALLRFDLFRVPRAIRRPLVPLTVALFVTTVFVFVHEALGGTLLARPAPFSPGPAFAALAVVGVLAFTARAALDHALTAARAPADAASARERLERYRLALEAARANPSAEAERDAQRLRRALKISVEEHDATLTVLDGNVVIPTSAIAGASPGQLVLGRYEVLRELGEGGQGRVLLARDRDSGAEVALKELPRPWSSDADARREALRREAAAASRIRSRHVAQVIEIAETPLQTYLVREYVPGDTIDEAIVRRGPMAPEEAVVVVDQLLAGLEAVHAAGLVHADVKPANVILRSDGRAVLIDQGASRAADPEATLAAAPDRLVSLAWAAPEQIEGGSVDGRTDVHQVGSLLYFLLTGKVPALGPLAWPPGVPEALRRAAERARAPDPAARFQTVAKMRAALA